jgi:hypothetical protein
MFSVLKAWLRGLDLNQRPSGYEPDELPGCSTPRYRAANSAAMSLLYTNVWRSQGRI